MGREWDLGIRDRRVARITRAAQDLPGQHLFQYLDQDGARQKISSTDVNAYLAGDLKLRLRRRIAGELKEPGLRHAEKQVLKFLGKRLRA